MPVLHTRSVADFPIGNMPLLWHHQQLPVRFKPVPDAWIDLGDLIGLGVSERLVDTYHETLGEFVGEPENEWERGSEKRSERLAKGSFLIRHSWDLLAANERHVGGLVKTEIFGEVHPLACIEGEVIIGEGTRILPGVFIEGNVVIGKNCKIGPNCYIRGNTSIGDRCHIGNAVEIKNSIILSNTNVGHLSYVGDSILGERVNLGAGTVVSNLRHDGKNHRTLVDGCLVDTGRRKFGTIIGDDVHTGIHTSIYPGRKLFPKTSTAPGEVVRNDIRNER